MPSDKAVKCARVALAQWDRSTAVNMVAIAGAESGWNPDTGGDSPAMLQAAGYTESAVQAATFNCPSTWNGHASWGWWQIFMPVHKAMLESIGAPVLLGPCEVTIWLQQPVNNAKAAAQVLKSQGYGAWTVFKTMAYLQYLDEAKEAVAVVLREEDHPGEIPGQTTRTGVPFFALIGLGTFGLVRWLSKRV